MSSRAKEWMFRLILLTGSLVVALVLTEVLLAAFFPLYGGRDNLTLDGTPIKEWFPPGTVYRQVSNEYDARTTITPQGHRVPGADGNPDVVFLGDSFTYGFGLNDDETFASIYCRDSGRACANLGMPGSGTAKQVRRLEQFVSTWHWKPREVKLFFFGMSGSLSAGNDFVDNYNYARRMEQAASEDGSAQDEAITGVAGQLIGSQEFLLNSSNVVRRLKYHWGPLLKTLLIDPPAEARMEQALRYTREGLAEFDALSRTLGFDYTIYLIVPVQDITRNSYTDTLAALNSVSPRPAVTTAELFLDHPERFYYAYDGHLNAMGSRRVAEFLLAKDRGGDAPR
jgi:hypothetical protein